jgi:hypothetical protein
MTEDKRKNDESKVEWSFDFSTLADSFRGFLNSLAGDEEVKHSSFAVSAESVSSAEVEIDFSLGKGSIRAGSDPAVLLAAEIDHVGEMKLTETDAPQKRVKLAQDKPSSIAGPMRQGLRALTDRADLHWDILLSPDVPLKLTIDGGVGPSTIDLSQIQLSALEIDSGVGSMEVTLPAGRYPVEIDGGIGQTNIVVLPGAALDLEVDGGVGAVNVTVPANLPVRIIAESGLGAISVPKHFKRTSGKQEFLDNSGTWESDGYELASERLFIRYDGGVGQFTLKTIEIV